MLGPNGSGKTTMMKMLTGAILPDNESIVIPKFKVSYKPQGITPKFHGRVQDLLY